MTSKTWQEISAAKKAEQLERIPKEWILAPDKLPAQGTIDLRPVASSSGILSERELKITEEYDATALVQEIAVGTYTAVEVVTAYCKRAAVGQQLCNSLTEIMFRDAIAAAQKLDETFNATGKTAGPLHGLPMTFKECFHVKGYDASDGYISRTFEPSTIDSYLIQIVRDAGAVVIAKTNTPQTMLVAEAHNNVFGQTKNPVVSHLTCGGSSGGEGSIIAFRGSALGIGTDVGGSIRYMSPRKMKLYANIKCRIPAAANGTYGYKPSNGILPMIGYAASNWPGMNTGVPAVCGPLANSLRDLTLLTKVVRGVKPWIFDPAVVPHICERGVSARKPVVGVISSSGLTPHPPILRGIREARRKLEAAGFEVKDFSPPDFADIRKVTKELFTLDGLSYPKRELAKAGEPVVQSVSNIGFWPVPAKTPEEMWRLNAKKLSIQKEMLDRWQQAKVDVVLCPAGPHTAVKPGNWMMDHYTVVWNAVDYPAVIIPFSVADPEKDPLDRSFVAWETNKEPDELIQAMYEPKQMAGAPVCLQLVGMRLEDEQLLKDAELIDQILNQ
ncbi:fatty-acid amide hydrolase (amidase) [Phlyctema vagabunda]|uniref:Fatty-acid amide hydrolase (Amidase) n=1 Tax=Phlyctema vagabunda TaxID=108571 RepID=A0ABR4PL56_9HELO